MAAGFQPNYIGGAAVLQPQYIVAGGAALQATLQAVASITASLTTAAAWQANVQARASLTADLTTGTPSVGAAAVWGYVMANGQTAEQNLLALLAGCDALRKVLLNKQITSPTAGKLTIYDDDDTTVLLQADLFEDEGAAQRYRGQGADRRERLT